MDLRTEYKRLFDGNIVVSSKAAKSIALIIKKAINPSSVVDVGCANGIYLNEFAKVGITKYLGIDNEWARSSLIIPEDKFIAQNLEGPISDKCFEHGRFDLAVCLETGEHIAEKYADTLVEMLIRLSDVVLFSAAIPGQTGTHHVNEQWQSYWAKKFNDKGYKTVDYIRHELLGNDKAGEATYLQQNAFLYIKIKKLRKLPQLKRYVVPNPKALDMVLPQVYESYQDARKTPWWIVAKGLYYTSKRILFDRPKKTLSDKLKVN